MIAIAIPFVLFEVQDGGEPRLFFTRGNTEDTQIEDSFNFPGPSVTVNKVFTVYALVSDQIHATRTPY